jgi:hypothetical protein
MTRQYIIAAIVGLILVTSLGIGGLPPAMALVTAGAVILMMVRRGGPHPRHSAEYRSQLKPDIPSATRSTRSLLHKKAPGRCKPA